MAGCDYKYAFALCKKCHRLVWIEHPRTNPRYTDYIDNSHIMRHGVEPNEANKMLGLIKV